MKASYAFLLLAAWSFAMFGFGYGQGVSWARHAYRTLSATNVMETVGAVVFNAEKRALPENIVIQQSSDGRFRWVAFSKEFPEGWPSTFTESSVAKAVSAYWRQHDYNELVKTQQWSTVTNAAVR